MYERATSLSLSVFSCSSHISLRSVGSKMNDCDEFMQCANKIVYKIGQLFTQHDTERNEYRIGIFFSKKNYIQ